MALREEPYENLGVIERATFGVTHDRYPDQARLALSVRILRGSVDIILTEEQSRELIVAKQVYDVKNLKGMTVIMLSNDRQQRSEYVRPE